MKNTQILLRRRPEGMPRLEDFEIVESELAEPRDGELVVAHHYIGLQPAARLRMGADYHPTMPLDSVPLAQAVGQVVRSRNPAFPEGMHVMVNGGWQSHSIWNGDNVSVIDAKAVPITYHLGCLGSSGMTAYVGLNDLVQLQPSQTIVISAATGAVGSVAGQLARLKGCRVVGVAGSQAKCNFAVREYGYTACIDHRADDFAERLAAACPDGVDIDFENVGGMVRDGVWSLMNNFGQVLICGLISEYNRPGLVAGPGWKSALERSLTVRGFRLGDHMHRRQAFLDETTELVARGLLKTREDITFGLANLPSAFISMLNGGNFGKTIVQVA